MDECWGQHQMCLKCTIIRENHALGIKNHASPKKECQSCERLRRALELIAAWPFDIMGDCVADARRVAKAALESK